MNRDTYLSELEKALRSARVQDFQEVLSEYAEHFERKQADGFSQEEIAARLVAPKELARQYAGQAEGTADGGGRAIMITGLVCVDVVVGILFILLYAWVLVIAVLAIAAFALGISLITGININGWIPFIPLIPKLITGIDCLALSLLSGLGTVYSFLFVNQLTRVYAHWHRARANPRSSARFAPTPPMVPQLKPKLRSRMRDLALVTLAVFAVLLLIGFLSMAISAGSFEFWHVWNWFGGASPT